VVRENVWNFPIGMVNVAIFSVIYFQTRLYADAGLQLVYFALGVSGWYLWLRGGAQRSALRITRASGREGWLALAFVAVSTLLLWRLLRMVGGSASFFDALTTSGSLASQWLLNKKRLENWLGWIVVDILYIPLYVSRGLKLTAILYAVFLAMAITGYLRWRALLAEPRAEPALVPAS
jgi:nicotinamide mononucleotide transporter